MIELSEEIKNIVYIRSYRTLLPEEMHPYYDWYIGEKTGLHTYLTNTGVLYYGKQPLKQ